MSASFENLSNLDLDNKDNAGVVAPAMEDALATEDVPAMENAPAVAPHQVGQHDAGPVVGPAHANLGLLQQQQQQPHQPNPAGSLCPTPLVVVAGLQHFAGGAPSVAVKVYSGAKAAIDAASGTGEPIFAVSSHASGVVGFGGWSMQMSESTDEDDDDDDDGESGIDLDTTNGNDNNMDDDDGQDDDDGAGAVLAAAANEDNDDDVMFLQEIITID